MFLKKCYEFNLNNELLKGIWTGKRISFLLSYVVALDTYPIFKKIKKLKKFKKNKKLEFF